MLLNPVKGIKGLGDLLRMNPSLEDVVLEKGVGRIVLLPALEDEVGML
jgi:hypothetical protein